MKNYFTRRDVHDFQIGHQLVQKSLRIGVGNKISIKEIERQDYLLEFLYILVCSMLYREFEDFCDGLEAI